MNIQRSALLLAASALASTATAQQASDPPSVYRTPVDRTYDMSVRSANGDTFHDCATFREDRSLVLQAGKGLIVDWLYETAGSSERNFLAVTDGSTSAANPIGLALHGKFVGADRIRGDAINALGLTFTFNGRLSPGCSTSSSDYPRESPYAAAPASSVVFEPGPGSVAGKLYAVRLYGPEGTDDCFHFVINGTLSRDRGESMAWGMNGRNTKLGTFQAVTPNASSSAGRALYGELNSLGELRVHGIQSDAIGLYEIVGSGREASGCVDQ